MFKCAACNKTAANKIILHDSAFLQKLMERRKKKQINNKMETTKKNDMHKN